MQSTLGVFALAASISSPVAATNLTALSTSAAEKFDYDKLCCEGEEETLSWLRFEYIGPKIASGNYKNACYMYWYEYSYSTYLDERCFGNQGACYRKPKNTRVSEW